MDNECCCKNRRVIGYDIVTGSVKDVGEKVRKRIKDGWTPLGAPIRLRELLHTESSGFKTFRWSLAQTMVMYES